MSINLCLENVEFRLIEFLTKRNFIYCCSIIVEICISKIFLYILLFISTYMYILKNVFYINFFSHKYIVARKKKFYTYTNLSSKMITRTRHLFENKVQLSWNCTWDNFSYVIEIQKWTKTLHFSRILTFIHIVHEPALENRAFPNSNALELPPRGQPCRVRGIAGSIRGCRSERSEARADHSCVHSSTSISQTARSRREGVAVASFTEMILFRVVVSRSSCTLPS